MTLLIIFLVLNRCEYRCECRRGGGKTPINQPSTWAAEYTRWY